MTAAADPPTLELAKIDVDLHTEVEPPVASRVGLLEAQRYGAAHADPLSRVGAHTR
jgi:hypothetical protein